MDVQAVAPDRGRVLGTGLIVFGPLVALLATVGLLWGRSVHLRDLVLAAIFYVVTGHGVTVGFHRMFTHRSFVPNRPLKIALAVAGSMAVQGSLISWVANHRRHHRFSDRIGDPHSPHLALPSGTRLRRFGHAHVGWLFSADDTSAERYAPDLLKDRDLRTISRLFPVIAISSLVAPALIGWLWSGQWQGAVTAFVWAGVVRMAVLHHVTWSVNSICHIVGRRPFATTDRSTNVAALAVVSMGESWHNSHHAHPSSARHGIAPGQLDSSAALIRVLERLGWASRVRWPSRSITQRVAPAA